MRFYDLPTDAVAYQADPISLLDGRRLDVMARILYARGRLSKRGGGWGRTAYENLIRSWTNDFTPPREVEPGRHSMDDYLEQFDQLIDSMSEKRFSPDISIVPTCRGTLVDGAHRVAAAVALGIPGVTCVELDGEPQVQDYSTLLHIGMDKAVVENLVLELIRLKQGSRLAILFPCARSEHDRAVARLGESFQIDYRCELVPTWSGHIQLMNLCYGAHDWWDGVHAERFSRRRIRRSAPLTLVFFQEGDQPVRPVKEELRELLRKGVDGIHTTDTHEETVSLAEVLLNQNGRDWLNYSRPGDTPRFDRLFGEFRRRVIEARATERVCVDSGGVLAAFGLRDVNDLDYLEAGGVGSFGGDSDINCHNGEYRNTGIDEEDIIYDPRKHFHVRGVKFASLDVVRHLKLCRGSQKDMDDVSRIRRVRVGRIALLPISLRRTRDQLRRARAAAGPALIKSVARVAKAVLPAKWHPAIRAAYLRWQARSGR